MQRWHGLCFSILKCCLVKYADILWKTFVICSASARSFSRLFVFVTIECFLFLRNRSRSPTTISILFPFFSPCASLSLFPSRPTATFILALFVFSTAPLALRSYLAIFASVDIRNVMRKRESYIRHILNDIQKL